MKKPSILLVLLVFALPASAENLQITGAWIKYLPTVVPVRANYMHISNNQSLEADDMMSMKSVDTLTTPAGGSLELAPGGFHLMMMNPLEQLIPGKKVTVTLHYQDQKSQTIDMLVRK